MIMPLDIQNKQFAKSVRGYKEEEVDQFLDMVTVDMDNLIQDNRALKEKIGVLEKELEQKKAVENSVLETLESTKALMKDISESAEKRAKIVLENAELDADVIRREAREEVQHFREEISLLKSRYRMFNERYKKLLESELEKFEELGKEVPTLEIDEGLLNGKEMTEE